MADIEKLKKELELLKEKNKLLEEADLTSEERAAKRKKEAEAEQERLKITVERLAYETNLLAAQGETIEYYEASIEFLDKYNKLKETALGQEELLTQLGLESAEQLEQMIKNAEMAKKKMGEFGEGGKDAYKKTKPLFEDIATKMFLFSPGANKAISKMREIGAMAASKKGLAGMTEAFKKTFNAQNMALGLFTKFVSFTLEYAFAVDKATAAFAKNTGLGRAFTTQISEIGNGYRNLGITAGDVQKATEGLINTFPMLTRETKENKDTMILAATSLEKIGVGSEQTGKMLTFFNKTLGKSTKTATQATIKIAMLGNALGKSAKQITKEFSEAMKVLAVYGDKAPKIFQNIATMAHSAGVEVSDLMGIASQFDEFGSAAATAAKMNAVLGTKLSGVNLLLMEEDEKIEAVIGSIQGIGKTFDTMNKFEKRLVANTAGIKDLDKAQRIFNMSLTGYREYKAELDEQADAQKKLEEKMKEAMGTVEKLKMALMNIAITLGPFTDTVADVAQGIADMAASMDKGWVKALLYAGAIGALLKFLPGIGLIGTLLTTFALSVTGLTAASAPAAAGLSTLGGGLAGLGTAGSVAIPVMLAVAAVFGSIGYAAASIASIPMALVRATKEVGKMRELFETIKDLDWESSLGGIGPALQRAQSDLNMLANSDGVKITNVLENLALIKTGRSSSQITSAVMATSGVGELGSDIKDTLKDMFQGVQLSVQLDGDATTKLLKGVVVKTTLK